EQDNRRGQRDGDAQPASECLRCSGAIQRRRSDAVARGFDRVDEPLDRDVVGALHGRLLGRDVHRRPNAFERIQLPLDPSRARRAAHALELQPNFRHTPIGYLIDEANAKRRAVILLRPGGAPRVTLEPSDTLGGPKNVVEIGQSLREARERRGIALPEAESATMIRARYLEALEVERFELLPEGPYLRSFLREYAGSLGLAGDLRVAESVRRTPPPPPEPEAAPPPRMTVFAAELVRRRSVLVAIGLIAAAIAVWQLGRSSHNAVQSAAANSPLVA